MDYILVFSLGVCAGAVLVLTFRTRRTGEEFLELEEYITGRPLPHKAEFYEPVSDQEKMSNADKIDDLLKKL